MSTATGRPFGQVKVTLPATLISRPGLEASMPKSRAKLPSEQLPTEDKPGAEILAGPCGGPPLAPGGGTAPRLWTCWGEGKPEPADKEEHRKSPVALRTTIIRRLLPPFFIDRAPLKFVLDQGRDTFVIALF